MAPIIPIAQFSAFPVLTNTGWQINTPALQPIIAGYIARSTPLTDPNSSSFGQMEAIYKAHEMENDFPTNEQSFADAIESVANRGGILIGTGHILPIIYGGWAGASHIYALDSIGEVIFGLIPLWGALLAMAKNRAEFASLLFGRPITSEHAAELERKNGEELTEAVWELPSEQPFSDAVVDGLAMLLSGGNASLQFERLKEIIQNVLRIIRKPYNMGPGLNFRLLYKTDEKGRGGPLVSTQAFQMSRDIFLEGRITGVASDFVGAGLDSILRQTEERKENIRTIYISNIPDWMNNRTYENGDEAMKYIHRFYSRLNGIPFSRDAVIVSSIHGVHTMAYGLPQHIGAWIPLNLPPVEAAKKAKEFYKLHLLLSWSMDLPLKRRLDGILSHPDNCDIRYRVFFQSVERRFKDKPLKFSMLEDIIRHIGLALAIPEWERQMLFNFLACAGLANPD